MDKIMNPQMMGLGVYLQEGTSVVCYGYHGAVLLGKRVKLDRNTPDMQNLENNLARMSGNNKDDHTVYRVQGLNDNKPTYFWFTGKYVFVGFDVELQHEQAWHIEDQRILSEQAQLKALGVK